MPRGEAKTENQSHVLRVKWRRPQTRPRVSSNFPSRLQSANTRNISTGNLPCWLIPSHVHQMARRTSSAARPHLNGTHANGARTHTNGDLPPPSTLAAQIVQNQARNEASQQNGEKATFAGLLREILHSGATPETDIQVNVQLITVVVEAGLTVLTRDDPFAQWDILLPQAVDSIAVVQATIVRQPDVLQTPISADGPQLLLWLLARLIAVCGKQKGQDLPIPGLLNAAFASFERSTKLWKSAPLLRSLIRDCVDGM